jgi:hypothetical protein
VNCFVDQHRSDLVADGVRMIIRLCDVMINVFPTLEEEIQHSSHKGADLAHGVRQPETARRLGETRLTPIRMYSATSLDDDVKRRPKAERGGHRAVLLGHRQWARDRFREEVRVPLYRFPPASLAPLYRPVVAAEVARPARPGRALRALTGPA